jgi:hypothetical protein
MNLQLASWLLLASLLLLSSLLLFISLLLLESLPLLVTAVDWLSICYQDIPALAGTLL